MQDVQKTILSQYACSPTINALIAAWNQAFDPSAWINDWYDKIWNLDTAQGYGLDVWGRIVGVERVLKMTADSVLGFHEAEDLTEEGFNTARGILA